MDITKTPLKVDHLLMNLVVARLKTKFPSGKAYTFFAVPVWNHLTMERIYKENEPVPIDYIVNKYPDEFIARLERMCEHPFYVSAGIEPDTFVEALIWAIGVHNKKISPYPDDFDMKDAVIYYSEPTGMAILGNVDKHVRSLLPRDYKQKGYTRLSHNSRYGEILFDRLRKSPNNIAYVRSGACDFRYSNVSLSNFSNLTERV